MACLVVATYAGCQEPGADDSSGTSDSATSSATSGDSETSGDSQTSSASQTSGGTGGETDGPLSGCGQQLSGGGTASGFTTWTLSIGGDEYKVQTNPWGGAEQTITAGGDAVFTVDSITHPAGAEDWEVASFPSVFRGTNYGGESTADSGMPIAIADITGVNAGLQADAVQSNYSGNATFDVYFTNGESYTGGAPDVYLMVWFDAKNLNPINAPGEGWDCAGDPPTFIDACSQAGETTVDGKKFYRFFGPNGSSDVITYVPETRMDAWEFDLNGFIQDTVGVGALTSDMYLQSVQGGFELTDAGTGLAVQEFCVDVY